ncbi:MAG: bifunctional (p)ppGpp synthetase/guanosine-3',5'-bis(diphosphate) 3'-pyrophosphohydrolase [Candidatus Eisenbacteria sp.]|nr:bifunctional (p)ppGpp synthetase/guanosine-3',5'-bis(diphosphate) 3'-pyrophosphohydrolase [Candidatus Eisenbacteria bacterium]
MKRERRQPAQLFEQFLKDVAQCVPDMNVAVLERAYDLARRTHQGQSRRSGGPFLVHPIEAARILLDLLRRRADLTILSAALLHDTVEDSAQVSIEDIERDFGPDVAGLVDGVTKIGDLPFRSPEVTQTENYRKMLLSMAKDIRVILIKLADRLHNMRTLDALEERRRLRIAEETLEIYAPIGHRLGMARLRWELEDLAFKQLDPEPYRMLVAKVAEKREERERAIEDLIRPIREQLIGRGVEAEVTGRPKHLRSIWLKMQRLEAPFEEIYDLLGLRILTETRDDCYRALGIVHDLFTPVADRFKDYVATPKSNMYQSLHTTVLVPERQSMVEIQIRTREMHVVSEIGIAAHYTYKEGAHSGTDAELSEKLGDFVVQGATEWQDDVGDPQDFMDFLRTSLYQDEVFVFTPKGGLKRLPRGATPIDFAYAIHTDVGHHCVGAKINGRIVPLRYRLRSGEVVEIVSSPQGQPSRDWVKVVATSRAKSKIRRWLAQQRLDVSVRLGREMFVRELKKRRLKLGPEKDLEDVSQSFGLADTPLLYAKIGQGDLSVGSVIARLHPEEKRGASRETSTLEKIKRLASRPVTGLRIGDVDGLLIRIAQCCQPIPGDKVVGLITKGRGISVHRVDCPNTFDDRVPPERCVEMEWDVERDQRFLVRLRVVGDDRSNLLADIAAAISRTETNMSHVAMTSEGEGEARGQFVLQVRNLNHLGRVIDAIRRIRGVRVVERASQGSGFSEEVEES